MLEKVRSGQKSYLGHWVILCCSLFLKAPLSRISIKHLAMLSSGDMTASSDNPMPAAFQGLGNGTTKGRLYNMYYEVREFA